jgi:hypothetical protein
MSLSSLRSSPRKRSLEGSAQRRHEAAAAVTARSVGKRWGELSNWIALAWAVFFGVLYVRMMLEAKAPGLLDRIWRIARI